MVNNTRSSKTFILKQNVAASHSQVANNQLDRSSAVVDRFAVNCATVDRDSKLLGLCNVNGDVGVFDLETMSYRNKINMHDMPVQGCAFSSDGSVLFTGAIDYKVAFVSTEKRPGFVSTNLLVILSVLLLAVLLARFFR